jgi:hypothetical protein
MTHPADAGHRQAARQLGDLLTKRVLGLPVGTEAKRLERFGLNPDGPIAGG